MLFLSHPLYLLLCSYALLILIVFCTTFCFQEGISPFYCPSSIIDLLSFLIINEAFFSLTKLLLFPAIILVASHWLSKKDKLKQRLSNIFLRFVNMLAVSSINIHSITRWGLSRNDDSMHEFHSVCIPRSTFTCYIAYNSTNKILVKSFLVHFASLQLYQVLLILKL